MQNDFGPILHHPMSNYQVHLLVPLAHNNESHPFGPNDRPCMTINKRFKGIGPSPNLTHIAVICAQVFGKKRLIYSCRDFCCKQETTPNFFRDVAL